MRWFKHMTDMRNDLFVKELRVSFGNEGYAIWCLLLEIYAEECGQNPGEFIEFSGEVLRKELGISGKKLELFLNFFQTKGKLLFKIFGKKLEIKIPKMASLKDNYTKDLQVACKQLAYKKKEAEAEAEEKKTNKKKFSTQPVGACFDFQENWTKGAEDFANEGLKAFIASGNPNVTNAGWVKGYLANVFTAIRNSHPEIPVSDLLGCWQECCDDASGKAVSSPKWYRTVYENRIHSYKKGPKTTKKPYNVNEDASFWEGIH